MAKSSHDAMMVEPVNRTGMEVAVSNNNRNCRIIGYWERFYNHVKEGFLSSSIGQVEQYSSDVKRVIIIRHKSIGVERGKFINQ